MCSWYCQASTNENTYSYVAHRYGIDECVKLLSGTQDLPEQEHYSGDSAIVEKLIAMAQK